MNLRRNFLLLGISALVAAAAAWGQHRKISSLQAEAAGAETRVLRKAADAAEAEASGMNGATEDLAGLSMAGKELLPELRLIVQPSGADGEVVLPETILDDGAERLMKLLASIGAAVFFELQESLPDIQGTETARIRLRQFFAEMNPGQSLALREMEPETPRRIDEQVKDYVRWAASHPGEAVRWYRDGLGRAHPVTSHREAVMAFLSAEIRIDPKRAVADCLKELSESGEGVDTAVIGGLVSRLRDPRVRMELLDGVNAAGSGSKVECLRAAVIQGLGQALILEPCAEVREMVDTRFRPEEKLALAGLRARVAGFDLPEWAGWMEQLGVPADASHPLVTLATSVAVAKQNAFLSSDGRKPEEPRWLDGVTAVPLRELAADAYWRAAGSGRGK